jgi:hypothetical protein
MKTYWTCFGIDLLVFLAAAVLFLDGLGSGHRLATGLYVLFFGIPAGVLIGGHNLKAAGRSVLATLLLATLAAPALLIGGWALLYFGMFVAKAGSQR